MANDDSIKGMVCQMGYDAYWQQRAEASEARLAEVSAELDERLKEHAD